MNCSGSGLKILHFRVRLASGAGSVGALYKNGHHQCHVVVEVVKGIKNGLGVWRAVELTEHERESVTITAFSNNPDAGLPQGWSCDSQRNAFDLGLWARKEGKARVEKTSEDFMFDCKVEKIDRYMRVEPDAPLMSVTLMAWMVVEGKVYTTNFSDDGASFESSVVVESVVPYVLRVADLSEYIDHYALMESAYGICYYWTPPNGLRFVDSSGLSQPIRFASEGEYFQTSYIYNVDNDVGIKIGVVTGKTFTGEQLCLYDVHHGRNYPNQNAIFRYHERPTVMRAIHLRDQMPSLRQDSRSIWRLWDNYGNLHSFILEADGTYRIALKDVSETAPESNIRAFKIFLAGESVSTNALYANGRHQCKVYIDVIKEEKTAGGSWVESKLTEAEKASLTVTRFSENDQVSLPPGWSCDKEKNMFDTGLWQRGAEAQTPNKGELEVVDSVGEWFERYMRFDSGGSIETHKFMARIIVGGKRYTTYNYPGDEYVEITPVRPYVLRARDLYERRSDAFYRHPIDVDLYHWLPPSGVRFVVNKGLDYSFEIGGDEGLLFKTSFSNVIIRHDPLYGNYLCSKIGLVAAYTQGDVAVRLKDIHQNIRGGDGNQVIKIDQYNTIMRAVRISWNSDAPAFGAGDVRAPWRLLDNFGCEHVFYLWTDNDAFNVKLGDSN